MLRWRAPTKAATLTGARTGWQPDPFGQHEFRFFSDDGKPTLLVADGSARSYDQPPPGELPILPTSFGSGQPPFESEPALLPAVEVREQSANGSNGSSARKPERKPEPVQVTRPTTPVCPPSPPMTRPTKYAFIAVLTAMTASALVVGVTHLESHGTSPSAASNAPASTSTTHPATGATKTTVALPAALKPTPAAAAAALIASWAAGNQAQASSVAMSPAVTTLFAGRYTPGLVIDRGCSVAFSPIVCTYGPPGGAAPTDPIYEIDVVQALGGWYVTTVKIDN